MYFKPPYLRFEGVNNNGVRSLLSHLRKRGGEAESRQVKQSIKCLFNYSFSVTLEWLDIMPGILFGIAVHFSKVFSDQI